MSIDVNGQTSEVTHNKSCLDDHPQLQLGATVPVKVDPNDHSQLLIALAG